jgi:hypothetical protein
MTSENQTKPSKRFAKLDAIPAHARMPFGVKSILAKLYIARRLTLSASVAVLVVAGGSIYAVGSSSVTSVEPLAHTAAAPEEVATAAALELPVIRQEDKQPVAAPLIVESKLADEMPANVSSAFATAKEAAPPVEVAAAAQVEEAKPAVKEEVSPVRQIIPVAEGLDLYRKPTPEDSAPPHVAEKKPEQAAKDAAVPFSLPTAGVPSEDDISGFLAAPPEDASRDISVIAPEDLSPTIALPEIVPLPEARPVPGLAEGQKVEFRIVQGPGIKSGFWIGNKEDASVRRFFVIVKPFLEDGTAVNWKFTNIADGSAADTDTMAVEVTEDAFIALAKESKELGAVKDPVLGRGVAGSKNVKWRIPSVQGNLLAGWDKEARK